MKTTSTTSDPPQLHALNARCRAFGRACRYQSVCAAWSMLVAVAWFPATLASAWLVDASLLWAVAGTGGVLLALGSALTLLWARRRRRLFRDIRRRAAGLSRGGFNVYKRADEALLGAFRRGDAPAGRLVLQLEKLSTGQFESLLADRSGPGAPSRPRRAPIAATDATPSGTVAAP